MFLYCPLSTNIKGKVWRQASAFLVTYPVNNAVNKEGNEIAKAVAWEKAFIKLAKV